MSKLRRLKSEIRKEPERWFHITYNQIHNGKLFLESIYHYGSRLKDGKFTPDVDSESYRGLVKSELKKLGFDIYIP